jgi:dihydroneopterin aldolase
MGDSEPEGDAPVRIEINGLNLFTHHGVDEAEREAGQQLEIDVALELDECDALETDHVDDTIDYAVVCKDVAITAQERSYHTLERLCAVIADRLIERFGADGVTVRATKPEPPVPLAVEDFSVEVFRERED